MPDMMVPMGVKDSACDDGESNLGMDWLDDPAPYTCRATRRLGGGGGAGGGAVEQCEPLTMLDWPLHRSGDGDNVRYL